MYCISIPTPLKLYTRILASTHNDNFGPERNSDTSCLRWLKSHEWYHEQSAHASESEMKLHRVHRAHRVRHARAADVHVAASCGRSGVGPMAMQSTCAPFVLSFGGSG